MRIGQYDALMGGGAWMHNKVSHKFEHVWRYLHLYDIMYPQLMWAPQNYIEGYKAVFSSRQVER